MYTLDAKVVSERIEVRCEIFEQEGFVLHTVNTAYPLETSPEEIKAEAQKAHDLFFSEREAAEEQKKTDERFKAAENTVAALNGQENEAEPEGSK